MKQQSTLDNDSCPTSSPPEAVQTVKKLVKDVDVADIGCGFGGLLVALAPILPDSLLLGIGSLSAKMCNLLTT